MNELEIFQRLKNRILESYQNSYPYFQGDWKNFSSKDIRQLIEIIEEKQKENVSEKWIYTHLKPEINEKLPRKDMLDIFSKFVGSSSWDEFVFQEKSKTEVTKHSIEPKKKKNKKVKKRYFLFLLVPIIGFTIYEWTQNFNSKSILIKNEFTKQPIQESEIEVFQVSNETKTKLKMENARVEIPNLTEKIIIESPYFEKKEVLINPTDDEVYVKPEDYAVVLKTFIESDIQNWEKRKEKLDKILDDNLEVILFQKENLGAEYFNKEEFSDKLILPSSETKKYIILELETNAQKKITYIRILKS